VPFATVVHTTDQPSETWATLITNWTTTPGDGSCAHFAIGRTEADGVVQMISIDRNANHAGGDGHGSFVAGAQSWHPNLVSVGIELHSAGAARQVDGVWRYVEDGAAQGQPIPDEEVIADPDRPGRGWHSVTAYQYAQLSALLDGLEAALAPLPAGCVAQSIEAPPAYGVFPTGRIVGHVSLTAARRGDPWPPTCDWIRAWQP
jgi:N-acetyl-anhydromuramyl-L-alanine amidase AmpD